MPVEIKQLMVKGTMEDEKEPSIKPSVPRTEMQEGANLDYCVKKQIKNSR